MHESAIMLMISTEQQISFWDVNPRAILVMHSGKKVYAAGPCKIYYVGSMDQLPKMCYA